LGAKRKQIKQKTMENVVCSVMNPDKRSPSFILNIKKLTLTYLSKTYLKF